MLNGFGVAALGSGRHCCGGSRTWAEAHGIAHVGTLDVLVGAVRAGRLDAAAAATLWADVQRWWDYAPSGSFEEYVTGRRPTWPPCSGQR